MNEALIAVTIVMATAIYTPGPNTLFALAAGNRVGFIAALPVVAWISFGCAVLLLLGWSGAAAVFQMVPVLRVAFAIAGAAYLIWMSLSIMRPHRASMERAKFSIESMSKHGYGLAVFQLLNPKAWALVVTVVAAMAPHMNSVSGYLLLAAIYVGMSVTSLMLWALAGSLLKRDTGKHKSDYNSPDGLNRILGGALMVSAVLIIAAVF